jgi:AcrR family transcriptional regulator
MTQRQQDKRSLRTRAWIVQAFNELIFKRTYAALPTDYIIKRAGVGRSTFYEHFRNKDEVLLHSVSGILSAFADAVTDAGNSYRIRGVLDHILDQKAMAQPLLAGPAGAAITAELSNLIESRLTTRNDSQDTKLNVPARLVARQVAAAQLSLLSSWLEDVSSCSSTDLATAICRSSRGLVASLESSLVALPESVVVVFLKRAEGVDHYDVATEFNPFGLSVESQSPSDT